MRNSRGEWDVKSPSDRDNFHFVRNSGLRSYDFDDETKSKWDAIVLWVAFICFITAYVGCFFFGWAS